MDFSVCEICEDEKKHFLVVTFRLAKPDVEMTNMEVFVDEGRKRLVVNVCDIETIVNLDPASRYHGFEGSKVKAKLQKKKHSLIITVPIVSSVASAGMEMTKPRSLTFLPDLQFPAESPVRIEIRPIPTGRCIVASRRIVPGEMVLFEEPFALLRLGEGHDESAPPAAQCVEWQLTRVQFARPSPPVFIPRHFFRGFDRR